MNMNFNAVDREDSDPGEIGRHAFELLEKWGIDPTPPAYEVAFLYHTCNAPDLINKPLDRLLSEGRTLSEYDLVQLHQQYRSGEDDDFLGGFKDELSKMLSFIDQQVVKSDKYEKRIEHQNEKAKKIGSVEQLHRLVGELVDENRKMQAETGLLRTELKRSGSTIENLETALNESREKEMRDPLTELGNRRFFDAWLMSDFKASVESGEPMCLAILDIDHFKRINDTYGHPVGDAVLCLFARIIRDNVKGRDRVARYGGEEFAIILPQTKLRAAVQLMDKIRREICARNIVILEDDLDIGKVTASIGVAETVAGATIEELINSADKKLYSAKDDGRNAVRF